MRNTDGNLDVKEEIYVHHCMLSFAHLSCYNTDQINSKVISDSNILPFYDQYACLSVFLKPTSWDMLV